MNMTKGIVLEILIQRKKSQNFSPTTQESSWDSPKLELNGLISILYSIFRLSLWMGGILLVLCKLVNVHYFSKEMYTYTSGLNHLTFKREIVIPKNHHVYQKQDQNII